MAAPSNSTSWQVALPAPRIVRWSLFACAVATVLVIGAMARDFQSNAFHPHGYCFLWQPTLVGLYVGADLTIGLSYLAISATLLHLVRQARGMLPFSWLFVAFGLFIVSCGLTHFMDVVTLWYTAFWVSADVRVVTALASFATAVALPRAVPAVLEVLRAARTAEMRRDELERSHAVLEQHASARTADLAASERQYRQLLDATNQGVMTVDRDGVVTFASRRLADMVGLSPEALAGRQVASLVAADSPVTPDLSATGAGAEVEVKLQIDGGAVRWVVFGISPGPVGEEGGRLVLVTDLTRHKLLEDQLRQAQKLEAVGRLASGVAHDFNNLITAMLGYSELIGPHLSADDRRGQLYLTEIHNAAERASSLTRQLLAFSRRQMLEPQEISLDELVHNAQRMLERVIGEDIHLVVRTAGASIRVYADPGQVEQVLMNLVVNARHAMPEGGTLTIETTASVVEPEAGPGVSLPPGRYASVSVTDTGTGIPPEVLPHIFEPFFTTKGDAGTGLGLATVYGIVKQSGGDVLVETRIDAGTTVRVFLPTVAA
jgi:PAS domain S-box-containing protein